ncbi:hypothetical protein CR513_21181, partial [Mucuna pruriens]
MRASRTKPTLVAKIAPARIKVSFSIKEVQDQDLGSSKLTEVIARYSRRTLVDGNLNACPSLVHHYRPSIGDRRGRQIFRRTLNSHLCREPKINQSRDRVGFVSTKTKSDQSLLRPSQHSTLDACKTTKNPLIKLTLLLGTQSNPESVECCVCRLSHRVIEFVDYLANRSVVQPLGVLKDVLVQVNELIFPTIFYVLDMEDETSGKGSTLILGQSFLMTTRIKIDVHLGTLSMEFDFVGDTKAFDCLRSIIDEADCDELWEVHDLSDCDDDNINLVDLSQEAELLKLIDQVCKHEDPECSNNAELQIWLQYKKKLRVRLQSDKSRFYPDQ